MRLYKERSYSLITVKMGTAIDRQRGNAGTGVPHWKIFWTITTNHRTPNTPQDALEIRRVRPSGNILTTVTAMDKRVAQTSVGLKNMVPQNMNDTVVRDVFPVKR